MPSQQKTSYSSLKTNIIHASIFILLKIYIELFNIVRVDSNTYIGSLEYMIALNY